VITQTSSAEIATLALRFQPTVKMSVFDRFWPVSIAAALDEYSEGRHTCLATLGRGCVASPATLGDLSARGSQREYLRYPERELANVEEQFKDFVTGLGVTPSVISRWRENPAALDPFASAQIYFYDAGAAPYPYPGVPRGLISLQYWFFYALNYYPTFVNPFEILSDPLASEYAASDYHEGDWEHITVLVDRGGVPKYLWMARHSTEGEAIPWSEVRTEHSTHPVVYPALGGHPSYQSCGAHPRAKLLDLFADYVACRAGLFTFSYASTPLVDLAQTKWACWPGHFGIVNAHFDSANNFDDPTALVLVNGPFSPLHQAENVHACSSTASP
jgi:hypothetical protein